ncbi:FKBP-type peptidyl-prolyl cis-trans isomerase N-terminal domain-containing protein, partial [Enterobacter ludwigii]
MRNSVLKWQQALAGAGFLAFAVASGTAWSSESLPAGTATVSPEDDDAPPATGLPVDQAATMIATLQKQLAEQQAILRQLQENAGAVKPTPTTAGADTPSVRPAAPAPEPGAAASAAGSPVPAAVKTTAPDAVPAAPDTGASSVPAAPVTVAAAPSAAAEAGAADAAPQTAAQRQAYASGVSVWREIESSMTAQRSMGIELDPAWVMKGLQDMAGHQPLRMSREQVDTIMVTLNEIYMEKAREGRERQQTLGRAYQSAFMKEKGASRDAGSLYRVVEAGKGKRIRASDVVTFTVTGTLPDGTVFDASGQGGQTKTAKVGALMPAVAIG